MANREFAELAHNGQNYPTWAMDVKIALASRGIVAAITPPEQREAALPDQVKYSALYIIRNHLHIDLKSEYLMEEEPSALWLSLKNRYEQQKAIILPEANHEWSQLRLMDFKSIGEYNHAVHKICSKLRFCEKELSEGEKIEKTISTMLPSERVLQHQYRTRNYPTYAALIQDLLQAEKHDEINLKNLNQRPIGAAPLPEVHHNVHNNKKFDGPKPKNFKGKSNKKRNSKKNKPNAQGKGKDTQKTFDKSKTCKKCGCYKHSTKKCRTPRHLVELYQQSLGKGKQAQGSGFESHFTLHSDAAKNASCSQSVPMELGNNEAPLTVDDYVDTENTIMELASNDVYGDLI